MSNYVQRVLEEVIRRNPGEPEFHQAVREVLESLAHLVDENPIYHRNAILERMVEPDRVLGGGDELQPLRVGGRKQVLKERRGYSRRTPSRRRAP